MSTGKLNQLLKSGGFQSFLWTQFFGAFNDNLFKVVVTFFAASMAVSAHEGGGNIAIIGAVFILPFLLFSGYAGHFADVCNKRTVLIVTKSLEILSMTLGTAAFLTQRIEPLLAVLFLMALQSTFFSPAKYGILPEMLPDRDLSRANGLLEMSTFLAIILGTALGGIFFTSWQDDLWMVGVIFIIIAVLGTIISFGIPKVPASGSTKKLSLNPWREIVTGLKHLYSQKPLWMTVVGISYFWFLGALFQMDIFLLGKETLSVDERMTGFLLTCLAVGIGVGSLLAGRLSGDKVELGLVPIGSIGMGVFSLLIYAVSPSYLYTGICLVFLGLSSGLFIVPLYAYLQQKSGAQEKGRLIATNNFLNTVGILLASIALWITHSLLGFTPGQIILALGILTLLGTIYILTILPDFLIRFTLWLLTHTFYKIRIRGQQNVPIEGPALLVSNHISYMDGLIIGACIQRFVRFMMYKPFYDAKTFNWFFRSMRAIPVDGSNRKSIVESIRKAREELQAGQVVCIFAEGGVSRTGGILPFKRGFEKIAEGLDAPIIPVNLDGLWGSLFSYAKGKFFWKMPQRIPYPVTVSFGEPMAADSSAAQVQQAVMELGSDAAELRKHPNDLLHRRFIQKAKRRWFRFCMADSSGKELNYGKTLTASLLLARWIKRQCRNESMIGLMLPSSVGGALVNIGALCAGKTPVNLNFTAGTSAIESAINQCNIRTIITSRIFLKKAAIKATDSMVFVEDILKDFSLLRKAWTAITAFILPARLLSFLYNREDQSPDDTATIIFSSGSTGEPKGVMLSHYNIISNVKDIAQVFSMTTNDRILGILPFFHSFGFTGALWLPLLNGFGVAYHPNPLEAKKIGQLVQQYQVSLMITAPTFCNAYIRKCTAEEFASLRMVVVGAEKLQTSIAQAFKDKFGLDLLEGYGCSEMSPCVAVNAPDVVDGRVKQIGHQPGTVGHPLPSLSVKVVNPDTMEPLENGDEGLLLVRGPSRMTGYLNQPEKTNQVFVNGWYNTGDIARIDENGFIQITDRLSRFSKIGGEMVPHIKIEEAINKTVAEDVCYVVSIPDDRKGEQLVVLYTKEDFDVNDVWNRLKQSTLPRLWIPKEDHFYHINELPQLGSGKVNWREMNRMARAFCNLEPQQLNCG